MSLNKSQRRDGSTSRTLQGHVRRKQAQVRQESEATHDEAPDCNAVPQSPLASSVMRYSMTKETTEKRTDAAYQTEDAEAVQLGSVLLRVVESALEGLQLSRPQRQALLHSISAATTHTSASWSHFRDASALDALEDIAMAVQHAAPAMLRLRSVIRVQSLIRGFLARRRWVKFLAVTAAGWEEPLVAQRAATASGRSPARTPAAAASISSYGGGFLASLRDWMNLESRYVSALEIMALTWSPMLVQLFNQWEHQQSQSTIGATISQVLKSLPDLFQAQKNVFSDLMDAVPILSSAEGHSVFTFHQQIRTLSRLLEQRRILILQQTGICRSFGTLSRILENRRAADASLDHLLKTGGATAADAKNPLRSLDVLDLLVEPFNFFPKLRFALERIATAFLSIRSPVRSADEQSRSLALAWGGFSCATALAISYHRTASSGARIDVALEHPLDQVPVRKMELDGTQVSIHATTISQSSAFSPSSLSSSTSTPTLTSRQQRVCLMSDRLLIMPSSVVSPIIFEPINNIIVQTDPVPASDTPYLCVWGAPTSSSRQLCLLMHFASETTRCAFLDMYLRVRNEFCSQEVQRWETITTTLHRLLEGDVIHRSEFHQLLTHAGAATLRRSVAAADWELLLSCLSTFRDPILPVAPSRGNGKRAGAIETTSVRWEAVLCMLIRVIRKTWLSHASELDLYELVGFITPWLSGRAFLDARTRQSDQDLQRLNRWLVDQLRIHIHTQRMAQARDSRSEEATDEACSTSLVSLADDGSSSEMSRRFEELHALFQPPSQSDAASHAV